MAEAKEPLTSTYDAFGAARLRGRGAHHCVPEDPACDVVGGSDPKESLVRLEDLDFVEADDLGTEGTERVERLRPRELSGRELVITSRHVVRDREIAEHALTPNARRHAGRGGGDEMHYVTMDENAFAYKTEGHRHRPEIEQELAALGNETPVTFVPHLLPLDRGILATIYVRVAPGTTEEALGDVLEHAYRGATFVRLVGSSLPEIKHVAHTNFCDIGWRVDPSGRAILVSVIDNLLNWEFAAQNIAQRSG